MNNISSHLREIRGGAYAALILKTAGFGGALLLSVVVARLLGAAESGLFFLTLTLVTIVSTLARVGLDKPIVRSIAVSHSAHDWESIRAVTATSMTLVAATSIVVAASLFLASEWLATSLFSKAAIYDYLRQMSWSIPAIAVVGIVAHAYQGLSRIALYLLLLSVLTPIIVVVAILMFQRHATVLPLALIYTIASLLTLAVALSSWIIEWKWPRTLMPWKSLSLVLISSRATLVVVVAQLVMSWTPVILLGMFADSEDVATYHVADRMALLISFALVAVNSIAAPKFAALFVSGQLAVLEQAVLKTTKMATLAAMPIALLFLVWPESSLLLLGDEFQQTSSLLRILAIGYLVTTATGSVSSLLLMTGHERQFRDVCLIGAVVNIAATTLGVWTCGAIGAAWATTGTLVVISVMAAGTARRHLGFSGIGWLARRDSDHRV